NDGLPEAVQILEENASRLKLLAEPLLEYETLNELEIKSLDEDGALPTRDPETNEYPRGEDSEDDQTGTCYDEIKQAHEERIKAMEAQHEEQKNGRRTLGVDDVSESEDTKEDETKTEKEPEDVDPKELESKAKEDS